MLYKQEYICIVKLEKRVGDVRRLYSKIEQCAGNNSRVLSDRLEEVSDGEFLAPLV